jgi:HSP20 family protein
MALVRWRSPMEEMARMEGRMRRLFETPFGLDPFTEAMGWMPAVQVTETDEMIEVTAELPGVTKDDIDISLEHNVLTIRGEKKEESEEKERERFIHERFYGSFQRAFTLPAPVDDANVKAEFKNGVLRMHLPKIAEAKGRKINITG